MKTRQTPGDYFKIITYSHCGRHRLIIGNPTLRQLRDAQIIPLTGYD
jgi:hypothetical protein